MIGQGQVLMSPAQMALVVAGIAGGTPVAPVEVVGAEPAGAVPSGPGPTILDALRPMMRQVVLTGTAAALADRGEVFGKTGTAEFGTNTPPDSHGWYVGYRVDGAGGPIAFAVLVEAGQSSSAAVAVADAFLGALG
jgi:cell division protein FtsI/penicillin-binding protein 2